MKGTRSAVGSKEEADFGRDRLAACGGEVLALLWRVVHGSPYCLDHVTATAQAPPAQLLTGTALHVESAEREEGHIPGDELLLDDAGVVETTWTEGRQKRQRQNPL